MKTPTDEELLAEFLRHKPDAFELLVRRHSPELYRFVLRFTNNPVAADDVVQETFLQVYQSAGGFDTRRRFKPWLFTIGANKARDWLRGRARRSEVPLDAQINMGDTEQQGSFRDLLESQAPASHHALSVEEQRRAVRGIVEQMPPLLREVLILAYYHRFPYREIAEILEIPVGTVKSRLHAAVAHFGKAYRSAEAGEAEQSTQDETSREDVEQP